MSKTSLLAKGAMIALTAASMTAVGTGSAHAATGCRLYVEPHQNQTYVLVEQSCQPAESGDLLYRTTYYGKDGGWFDDDDLLFSRFYPTTPLDSFTKYYATFNEDSGADEIFTKNLFVRPNGSTYSIDSNTVTGYW
ncbi:hypothetical protein GCM10027589_24520 [Actinocorallia lasiicapitis]